MRDSEFEELVNLYLDSEITEDELQLLHRELRVTPSRRKTFESYYRLHRASCAVLSKAGGRSGARALGKFEGWNFSFIAQAAFGAACLLITLAIAIPSFSRRNQMAQAESFPPPTRLSEARDTVGKISEPIDQIETVAVDPGFLLPSSNHTVLVDLPQSRDLFLGRIPVILNVESPFENQFERVALPEFPVHYQERYQSVVIESGRSGGYRPQFAGFTFQR